MAAFSNDIVFHFTNLTFVESTLVVQNVNLVFTSVHFREVFIGDVNPRSGDTGQINVEWSETTFHDCFLSFNKTRQLTLVIAQAKVENLEASFDNILALALVLNKTDFLGSSFEILVDTLFVTCVSTAFVQSENIALQLKGRTMLLEFTDLTVQESKGGLEITKQCFDYLNSWLEVYVVNSTFANNTKLGSGGAILFSQCQSAPTSHSPHNSVQIFSSIFSDNIVRKVQEVAKGGALAVLDVHFTGSCSSLFVQIIHTVFHNNEAEEGGGGVYASEGCIELGIMNSSFYLTHLTQKLSDGLFLLSHSNVLVEGCQFETNIIQAFGSFVDLQAFNELSSVHEFHATFSCPPWFFIEISKEVRLSVSGDYVMPKLAMGCTSCPASYYFPAVSLYRIKYEKNTPNVVVTSGQVQSSRNLTCTKCPVGGDCPGYVLKSKPNYWGYMVENHVYFAECPLGYCCKGNAESPCTTYNTCSGNREGLLCGVCKANYSLSIMSTQCIANTNCNNSWIWFVAVVILFLYTLWYTFKDSLLSKISNLPAKLGKFVVNEENKIDKGYFGILIYFVQTEALIELSFQEMPQYKFVSVVDTINFYAEIMLTFDLSSTPMNVCPVKNLTLTSKTVLKFFFLIGLYISWLIVFLLFEILSKLISKIQKGLLTQYGSLRNILMNGIVEIIKYTYSGVSDIVFFSLACKTIRNQSFWFHDGTVQCFTPWQTFMLAFCFLYVTPFPLALFFGLKCLKTNCITSSAFLAGLCLPGPSLVHWIWITINWNGKLKSQVHHMSLKQNTVFDNMMMFDRFRGAYRMSNTGTEYWECVIILRRLLVGATALISNSLLRLSMCAGLVVLFFWHHMVVQPFVHKPSNHVESLSLCLLTFMTIIGIIKSNYVQSGMSLGAEATGILKNLGLLESLLLPSLILCICLVELYHWKNELYSCSAVKRKDRKSGDSFPICNCLTKSCDKL